MTRLLFILGFAAVIGYTALCMSHHAQGAIVERNAQMADILESL